jgi:type VI protein secretion system component Hcp
MATIFMLAAPFKGESKAKGYEGNVDLESVSFGVSQMYRVEMQGGGAQATGMDISCTKGQDSASPLIQQQCLNGETIPTVEIHFTKQIKDSPILIYKLILGNVVVSSYMTSSSGGPAMDSFSLNYGSMKVEYIPVDEKGKAGGAKTAGYDFIAQTPL